MGKKLKYFIIITILIIIAVALVLFFKDNSQEVKNVKSEKELSRIYDGDIEDTDNIFIKILTMPFSFLREITYIRPYKGAVDYSINSITDTVGTTSVMKDTTLESSSTTSSSKDYSTTNIQVENVDEADITKTDGDYIYSISDNNVIITNVKNPQDIKIEAKISPNDNSIPVDLMLYKNELVVISDTNTNGSYYSYNKNTDVKIYNISEKSKPTLIKEYELQEPYYTSRCIENKLYVIASGNLRKENNKILRNYKEDSIEREISLEDIKYLKDIETRKQTLISVLDLDNAKEKVNVQSYLIDISNAYVSENSIYLLNQKYNYSGYEPPVSSIFGWQGLIGAFTYEYDYEHTYTTEIYKFDISKDGKVNYKTKTKIKGKTINQYSLDEKDKHLRVALFDNDGTRIVIFDENLNQIGASEYVAKGETMYSSRFIGDKAYLVTYRTVDPLFVIDLSNENKPRILGQLKIPGYSTYLHPYDENHLIGIGMETEEVVNRNYEGKVISTTAKIVGMKMALFDVSDVNNPIQMSQTVIGDRRTTSAILTNPKALLFSKEKELIAIPVNNYAEDFEVSNTSDNYSSVIDSYTKYNKDYIAEGYFVYNINLKSGFTLKGVITHQKTKSKYSYYRYSKLLRGLYIDDNLYTVSEDAVKVNKLNTLEQISELKIR